MDNAPLHGRGPGEREYTAEAKEVEKAVEEGDEEGEEAIGGCFFFNWQCSLKSVSPVPLVD